MFDERRRIFVSIRFIFTPNCCEFATNILKIKKNIFFFFRKYKEIKIFIVGSIFFFTDISFKVGTLVKRNHKNMMSLFYCLKYQLLILSEKLEI